MLVTAVVHSHKRGTPNIDAPLQQFLLNNCNSCKTEYNQIRMFGENDCCSCSGIEGPYS